MTTDQMHRDSVEEVVSSIWSEHAEVCTKNDWEILVDAAKAGLSFDEVHRRPDGEAADEVVFSLKVIYWALKVALLIRQAISAKEDQSSQVDASAIRNYILKTMPLLPKPVERKLMDLIARLSR